LSDRLDDPEQCPEAALSGATLAEIKASARRLLGKDNED
jgi:hypothetical protein